MGKKTRGALAVIRKVCKSFPEARDFIDKAFSKERSKENIAVYGETFFTINNSC